MLRAERGTGTTHKHHTEFRYGTFARAVRLPAGARGDEATADYRGGARTRSAERTICRSHPARSGRSRERPRRG